MATAISYRNHEEPPVSPIQTEFSSPTAQRISRNDGDFGNMSPVSPIMSRRASYDSDRHSTGSGLASGLPANPTNVNPAPAYVASTAASRVVSEHRASQDPPSSDSEEDGGRKDDIQFSPQALAHVNAFLDQLLYSFLSASRSTSLQALRPAVTEVLKHRLAKDAISSADEELADLLPGVEDEEDVDTQHRSQEEQRQWDLELVWKRTRLRVMVYIQLGEMENEDEQRYVQEEGLFYASERRFTSSTGLVSWSAAIFLTSVLEYIAEQTLQVAGQAAHTRARRQSRTHRRSMSSDVMKLNDFMVEEHDVEKVALNPTLGRLWRTWRKSLRNTAAASSSMPPSSPATSRTSRPVSGMGATEEEFTTPREGSVVNESRPTTSHQHDDIPEMDHPEHILAANIPLPMWGEARDIDEITVEGLARDMEDEVDAEDFSDSPYPEYMLAVLVGLPPIDEKRDVDEIEVPGLARDPDAEEKDSSWLLVSKESMRRRSFSDYLTHRTLPEADEDAPSIPTEAEIPVTTRPRSMSHSMPARTPMFVEDEVAELPPAEDEVVEQGKEQEQDLEEVPLDEPTSAEKEANDKLEADDKEPQDTLVVAENDKHEAPQPESEADKNEAEFPWMAAGVGAAAATAVGATAVALASGDKSDEIKEADISPDSPAVVPGKDLKAPPAIARSMSGAEKEAVPSSPSEKDVEELDKRKSLLNIKDMMVVNGRSGETSGERSPEADNDSASNYSVDLDGEKDVVQSGEESLQNDKDDMGVARGVDITEIVEAPSPDAEMQQARDLDHRPADLNMDAVVKQPEDDQATEASTPRTPRQFLDLTDNDDPSTDAPPLPAATAATDLDASNGVASIANIPQQENASPSRSTDASIHKKQSSESAGVQEHPMVQRLASLKGNESGSASASEKAVPATSAAIRGPEDFDQLIQNGETLKYTLTPEHVRDEPIDGQTRYIDHPSPVEMDATSPARELTSPVDNRTGRAVTSEGKTSTAEKRRSQSRPTPTHTGSISKSGLMAREPRVATESTRDFADFIRSTGPDKDAAVSPLMRNASQTSLHSLRSAHIRGASASRSSSPGRDPTGGVREDEDVPPVPRIARRHKTGMEARGAKIVGNGSSDLIDFIRAGPKLDGEHRISRSVAPFRTTMDSDRFNDASADGQLDSSLRTTPSFSKASSHRTSANSRSALLVPSNGTSQAVQPASNGASSRATDNLAAPDIGNGASKKQYRNKDPYAIDFDFDDDDDDDLIIDTPRGGQKDESFLEFLRNHEPVSNEPIRPLIDPNSAQARRIINNARSGNVPVDGRRGVPTTTVSRTGSQPSVSSKQAQINSTVSSPKRKLEAKSPDSKSRANTSSLNTNDLAHFIRNSGPPDDPDTAPAPEVGRTKLSEKDRKKAEKQKRGSIFSRGKTQRYLDMP